MNSGWIFLDKPVGISSAKAVYKVKSLIGVKKSGHAGTLDPLASGMLPIAIGNATKLMPYFAQKGKAYEFDIMWGAQTDTMDREGQVIKTCQNRPSADEIQLAVNHFAKDEKVMQTPPAFSAIKVDGKRSYDLARKGIEVKLKPRQVSLYQIESREHSDIKTRFFIDCSCGFYVRSLALDIANFVGSVGHVSYLRRLRFGKFTDKAIISLDYLEKMVHNAPDDDAIEAFFSKHLLHSADVLDDILVHFVSSEVALRLRFGQRIKFCEFNIQDNLSDDHNILVMEDLKERNIVALCRVDTQNCIVRPLRVF